jgi:tetratricopeptide (TPR) repeat protein
VLPALLDVCVFTGDFMAFPGKPSNEHSQSTSAGAAAVHLSEKSQLDFEIDFYGGILARRPDYLDVLRGMGNNLTLKGRYADGLAIDNRLVQLRPRDPLAHYNLACSFALLKRPEHALRTLRKAVELGYRDFRYMREDHDLDSVRHDPRFRQLLREFEGR